MDKFSTAANAIINQLVQIHENSTSESTSLPCLIMSENRASWLSGAEVNASLEVGATMQEERIFKTPSGVDRRRCNLESSSKGPHFTMRGYVLGVRREDLKKTWPFSQKHLRLWLERGKEPLLPPLDSPHPLTLLSSQDHHNCQQSEQAIISKEEESFDTRATELQVSSKEGSTLPESELDINIIKSGNSSEKQWPKTVPEIYCNRVENRNIRQISSKLSRRRNQLVCRRKRTAKGKVGKKLQDSKIRSFPFNELEHNFLKKRNAAKVRIDNTSVDSSREDAVVDLAGKVRTVSQGQDLCTKERCEVVQHTVEISQSVKDRSNNCKAEKCNIDIQAQESTSSLSPVQLLNSSKENAETQGKGICHEGEISYGECGMSTLKECAMEFEVEEDEGTSQLRGELMGASEGKAEYRNENLIIARKDFANQEEQEQNDEKANRHEVTKEITRVLEDTPSKTADVELAKKCAEVGVGAMISDSLIPKMCPVCRKFVSTSNTALNAHIDHCLTVGAPFGDPVRLQKNRRKQKIRSIADICAKVPTSMLDQKTAKNMNLALSSCILDWKGRRMQPKCRISALKPCEMRIKLYSDKKASKRRRTVSDFENFCKHKTNTETGKPRHTIGIKRKQQTILDSDNHLNWDTSKSSTTSVSNFPSKVEILESQGHSPPGLEVQNSVCQPIKAAQTAPFSPQASILMKKHRAHSRRRKNDLKESHLASEYSRLETGKVIDLTDDPSQSVHRSSKNNEAWLLPAAMGNGKVIKARHSSSETDRLQMLQHQLMYTNELFRVESLHVSNNPDESEMSGQDHEKKRGASSGPTEKESQSQSTVRKICRNNIGSEKYSHVAQVQNLKTFDNVQVVHSNQNCQGDTIISIGTTVKSRSLEVARPIETTFLSSRETKEDNSLTEFLSTEINNKTEHLLGGRSNQCESKKLLVAPNSNNPEKHGNCWQSSMEDMDVKDKTFVESDIGHSGENNVLVSARLAVDTNAGQMMLKPESSSTGIGFTFEEITLQSVSLPLSSSTPMDCPKNSVHIASFFETQDSIHQRLSGSSFTTNQLVSKGHLSYEPSLKGKATIRNWLASGRETEVISKNSGCSLLTVEESLEERKPLLAGYNQQLTSLHIGLPSVSCPSFDDKMRNQQGSMSCKPYPMVKGPLNSAFLPGMTAPESTIDLSTGISSNVGSWTAAVKMASLGTQLWDMPGGAFSNFHTSTAARSASEPRSQTPKDCIEPMPVTLNPNSPSRLSNLSTSDSLCTTVSSVLNNPHMHQNSVRQCNSVQFSRHCPGKEQGSLSMDETCWGACHNFTLRDEENPNQGHEDLRSHPIVNLSESGNAPFQTTATSCIRSTDFSLGWLIENSTVPKTKQLLSSEPRCSPFEVPATRSSETQVSAAASNLLQYTAQPAVIHIFGKPIFVCAPEHDNGRLHANNQMDMVMHGENAFQMMAPLLDTAKKPLPTSTEASEHCYSHQNVASGISLESSRCPEVLSARTNLMTSTGDFAKPLFGTLDATENMRELVILDDMTFSKSHSGQLISDMLLKADSSSKRRAPSVSESFLSLDRCVQDPTIIQNLCIGDGQTGEFCEAVQLMECSTGVGTTNLSSSPNLDIRKHESCFSTGHANKSYRHAEKDPDLASYCSAQANLLCEPKPGLDHSSSSDIKTPYLNTSRLIFDGCARHIGTKTNESDMLSNIIIIDDDDDEDVVNPIRSAIGKVSEFKVGELVSAEGSGRPQKMKPIPSSLGSLTQTQQAGPKPLIVGSHLESRGTFWRNFGQNLPTTTSKTILCDTSEFEAQLIFDRSIPPPSWMQRKRGATAQAFRAAVEMVKGGFSENSFYHSSDRAHICKQV